MVTARNGPEVPAMLSVTGGEWPLPLVIRRLPRAAQPSVSSR
jgi:hypothetical protein